MSNVEKLRKRAADFEAKRQIDKAIATYLELFKVWEADDRDIDVALFNRAGDLLVREGNVGDAVSVWEQAVDHYADGGFHNNAIALCNKILRHSPGRTSIYYKLGKISAQKGFKGDAKKNFLEYADRMQKSDKMDEAFRALKEFADLCPDEDDIRQMLADQLAKIGRNAEAIEQLQVLYERYESTGDTAAASAAAERIKAIDPTVEPRRAGPRSARESSGLVFIDLGEAQAPPRTPRRSVAKTPVPPISDSRRKSAVSGLPLIEVDEPPKVEPLAGLEPTVVETPEPPTRPAKPVSGSTPVVTDVTFGASFGTEEQSADPGSQLLDLQPTSLDPGFGDTAVSSALSTPEDATFGSIEVEGFGSAFGADADVAAPEPLDAGANVGDGAPDGADAGLSMPVLEMTEPVASDESMLGASTPDAMATVEDAFDSADALTDTPLELIDDVAEADVSPPLTMIPLTPAAPMDVVAEDVRTSGARAAMPTPVTPMETPIIGEPIVDAPIINEPIVDEPIIEEAAPGTPIGADVVAVAGAEADAAVEDPADAADAEELAESPVEEETPRRSTHRSTMSLMAASVDFLRDRVQREPTNWQLHREFGEALLEDGDRAGGLEYLENAMGGFERDDDLESARSVADEIIRLNPHSVRHHQKRVEYAFRMGDRPRLIEAYVELADALFRAGQAEKSKAVYQRVLELAPDDIRAQAALSAFVDEPAPPPPPAPEPRKSEMRPRRYTAATPIEAMQITPPPAPPEPAESDEFVSLEDWLTEDEGPKSTRMVVEEKEPTGDEDADFNDMLRKFKQGVAQNVEEEDHESHYDLGIAYKEMGLVEEAIAEFQKALRGTSNRVRTYEALGQCFVEKKQESVAMTILQRALVEPGVGDDQLVGVLYLLGLSAETLKQPADAVKYYQRVFAVDINFRDVQQRMREAEQAAR